MKQKFKQDKGVAGLTVLLSVIVMLFIIGFLVMVFSLMGSNMRDATYTETTATATNQAVTQANLVGGHTLTSTRNAVCSVTTITNGTIAGTLIGSGNYSVTGCALNNLTSTYLGNWHVNYTYVYDADNTATDVMNDTYVGIAGVTDWFEIFIVISAMVVLILLTVIIITAIRGSGLVAGGGAGSTRDVGTA